LLDLLWCSLGKFWRMNFKNFSFTQFM
jgi:hypothetical protein